MSGSDVVLEHVSVQAQPRIIPRPSERSPNRYLSTRPAVHRAPTSGVPRLSDEGKLGAVGPLGILVASIAFGVVGTLGMADTTFGLLVVPAYATLVWFVLNRRCRSSLGPGFVTIAFAGLAARMIASVPRLVEGVDSVVYHTVGTRLAESFRQLDFSVPTGRSIPGTGSVRYFVGLVNVVTNSSFVSTYLLFTLLAFAGQVFFLAGVRSLMTVRQFRLLAILVMFWPSLMYWPSSIGKEAIVIFGLGLTTFGAAGLYKRDFRSASALVIGLSVIGMVRPHVAMIVLAALLVGLFTRADETRSRAVVHVAALGVVIIGAMLLTDVSASLVGLDQLDGIEDLAAALDFAEARTSQDQAAFVAQRVQGPLDYPWAAVTVLFRPFPWEATNTLAMVSGVESLVLLALLIAAVPGLFAQARRLLNSGLILNTATFILVFVFLFSAIGNFGILSRQRVQMLPFILIFVALGLGYRRLNNHEYGARS